VVSPYRKRDAGSWLQIDNALGGLGVGDGVKVGGPITSVDISSDEEVFSTAGTAPFLLQPASSVMRISIAVKRILL